MSFVMYEDIAENVKRISEMIDQAAFSAGRDGSEITILAASKMNGADRIRAAYSAGIRAFGENRAQELKGKNKLGAYEGAKLHFIGHLQRNKVKELVGVADIIESVDSEELIKSIGARAESKGLKQRIFIEVNIGGDANKSGIAPERTEEMLAIASETAGILVEGLMTVPPISSNKCETRGYFNDMRKLFIDMSAKKYDNVNMSFLSMGMSGDFEEAIAEGANIVRIGSAIFGRRNYNV